MHTTHQPDPDQPDEEPRVLLTVEAAAEQLSISRTSMFGLIRTNAIETVKVGRLRRVPADDLDSYVRQLAEQQRAA